MINALLWMPTVRYLCKVSKLVQFFVPIVPALLNFRLVGFYDSCLLPQPIPQPSCLSQFCLFVFLASTKGKKQPLTPHFIQCKLILIDRALKHLSNIHFPWLFLPGIHN